MAEEGFEDKLLRKLIAVEGERLEAEAVRAKIKPRTERSVWSNLRGVLAWQARQLRLDLVAGVWILGLVATGTLAGKVSGTLFMLWFLSICLVLIFGTGKFLYCIGNAAHAFLTWKKPT